LKVFPIIYPSLEPDSQHESVESHEPEQHPAFDLGEEEEHHGEGKRERLPSDYDVTEMELIQKREQADMERRAMLEQKERDELEKKKRMQEKAESELRDLIEYGL